MADDTVELLRTLEVENADLFGYSMGGGIALQIALRNPDLVRKLVIAGTYANNDGAYPQILTMTKKMTPADFEGFRSRKPMQVWRLIRRTGLRSSPKSSNWISFLRAGRQRKSSRFRPLSSSSSEIPTSCAPNTLSRCSGSLAAACPGILLAFPAPNSPCFREPCTERS